MYQVPTQTMQHQSTELDITLCSRSHLTDFSDDVRVNDRRIDVTRSRKQILRKIILEPLTLPVQPITPMHCQSHFQRQPIKLGIIITETLHTLLGSDISRELHDTHCSLH